MNEDQWKQLVKAIEQRECILFLGPGTSTTSVNRKSMSLTSAFSIDLDNDLVKNNKEFEREKLKDLNYIAERYLTIPNATETDPAYLAKNVIKYQLTIYQSASTFNNKVRIS